MKHRKLIAGIIGTAMMLPMMAMPVLATEGEIDINATTFPDPIFRQVVMDRFDRDNNGKLNSSERSIRDISISEMDISSIAGIEYFENLSYLECNHNQLTSIDVSHNAALSILTCSYNSLTSIDVSNNPALFVLDVSYNKLNSIDVSHNAALASLECNGNQITNIDVSNNPELNYLSCSGNSIASLDLSHNNAISTLFCSDNLLTSIDVSNLTQLDDFYCANNQLTSLDLSINTNLGRLLCSGNQLTSLDLSNNGKVYILECYSNKLTSLDLSNNTNLYEVYCYNNQLKTLDFSNNTKLRFADCHGNRLTNLNVSNTVLTNLNCSDNRLTSLDLSNVRNLEVLDCYFNQIENLDLSANTKLLRLSIDDANFDADNIPSYIIQNIYNYNHIEDTMLWKKFLGIYSGIDVYANGDIQYVEGTDGELTYEGNYYLVIVQERPSGVEGFAERLYTCALERDFDEEGKTYWVNALRHGTTGADAAYGFLFSEEVLNANLTDAVFVNRLYATLMNRKPDYSETEYWTGAIADGTMTRQDVFAGFINSEEWANICVSYGILSGGTGVPSITVEPSQAIIDFATRLYTTCLNREADQAGLEWWASELANLRTTGSAAAQSYFFSEEFVNANVNDREFVNRLYLTFMNRNAADGEFTYWLGEMDKGMTRETVFGGFANSEEFGNICAEYGIIR